MAERESEVASSGNVPAPLTLSEEQQYAFQLAVKEHRTVFITGGAGTGKSHLLRTIIEKLPFSATFVTATTGIAALNLSGTTLHSFVGCGVPDKRATAEQICAAVHSRSRCVKNWRMCRTLIIDEVSMLDGSFFELIDFIARRVRNRPYEPFGGVQLILSGDFLQLPPVAKDRSGPVFCFETDTWRTVNPKVCMLSTPFRQRDLRFFSLLNEMRFADLQNESAALLHSINTTDRVNFVRRGAVEKRSGIKREGNGLPEHTTAITATTTDSESGRPAKQTRLELVNSLGRPIDAPFDGYTILRPTRVEVDAQNMKYYNQLDTEVFMYSGSHKGIGNFPEKDLSKEVHLRKGCRVMLIKNFDLQIGLVNGSTGTVTGFVSFKHRYEFKTTNITSWDATGICIGRGRNAEEKHTMLPVVAFDLRLPNGEMRTTEIVVEPQEWVEKEGSTVKSRTVQLPLILAYAITIHKSQGMSLTQVDIDFHKVFEAGQAYVALSRCTDLQKVRLHGFSVHLVSANSKALAYYKALALQRQRIEWQRQHTPHVVAASEAREALTCTPYGYVVASEGPALLRYQTADLDHETFNSSYGTQTHVKRDAGTEEEDAHRGTGGYRHAGEAPGGPRMLLQQPEEQHVYADAVNGDYLTEDERSGSSDTVRLDELRRHITPLLTMSEMVKGLVLRDMLPLSKVRSTRLVMDINALFHLVTGPESALTFDQLFIEQDNMMRVPLCVQRLIEAAAAYRGCSRSASPSNTPQHFAALQRRSHGEDRDVKDEQPINASDSAEQLLAGPPSAELFEALFPKTASGEDAALLEASDVAAEALAVMERAKQEFLLDVQRPEHRADLPAPVAGWLRFAEVLPLLQHRPAVLKPEGSRQRTMTAEAETARETNFILNRDPREAVQHREILEYARFLQSSFGQDIAVCTDSILLAAYALAWGLRVVTVESLRGGSA